MAKNISGDEKIEIADDIQEIKQARTALANLILQKAEELKQKRIQNPETTMNAMANIFSAIK